MFQIQLQTNLTKKNFQFKLVKFFKDRVLKEFYYFNQVVTRCIKSNKYANATTNLKKKIKYWC